jgi:prepilin-type N-terminal cleavage/methylation domain-containing protein
MQTPLRPAARNPQAGFTLVELLTSMAITTVIVGATMGALSNAIRATETATLVTGMNNGLRTTMDLMVRDMLQVGQGLPSGNIIALPTGSGSSQVRLPGPPAASPVIRLMAVNATEINAVIPGPGLGPLVNGRATDMITTIAADSSFERIKLTALAANGSSMTVRYVANTPDSPDIDDGGADDVDPGNLIMLQKGSSTTLVQVSRVVGQQVFFDSPDSLNLNQAGAADGNAKMLYADAPPDVVNASGFIPTLATRIRMVSFYIDATTDPTRPRLVRRINNGNAVTYDNTLGNAVAFDIENLTISYDLADGVTNPTNIRMTAADIAGTSTDCPDPCSPNQIRKVNVLIAGRSRSALKGTKQYFRNQLLTQVSLRSLAFVDRYK